LFGRYYWAGLIRWLQSRVLRERKIAAGDLDLMLLTDDPAQAAQAVITAYESQARVVQQRAAQEEPKTASGASQRPAPRARARGRRRPAGAALPREEGKDGEPVPVRRQAAQRGLQLVVRRQAQRLPRPREHVAALAERPAEQRLARADLVGPEAGRDLRRGPG